MPVYEPFSGTRRKTHRISRVAILCTWAFLVACFAASQALAQVSATSSGGNRTSPSTWNCTPAFSPCLPNNGTPPGEVYNVGISNVGVLLNGNSSLTNVTVNSLSISNTGVLEIDDAHKLSVTGDLTNDGYIYVDMGTRTDISGGSTLNVGGALTNRFISIGNDRMMRPSTVNVTGAFTGGSVHLDGSGVAGAQALLNVATPAPSTLVGYYELTGFTGGAAVEFGGANLITQIGDGSTKAGAVNLSGTNAFLELSSAKGSNSALTGLQIIASNGMLGLGEGAALVLNTSAGLTNHGNLQVDGGFRVNSAAGVTNSGKVGIGGPVHITGAYTQTDGMTYVDVHGTLMPASVSVSGGTLSGDGAIQSDVSQTGGTVQPGQDLGGPPIGHPGFTLSVTGDYLLSNSTYNEEIEDGVYSMLDVTGTLTLSSDTLVPIDVLDLTPADGEAFFIAHAGSVVGTFLNNDIPFAGGTFTVKYNPASVELVWNSPVNSATPEPATAVLLSPALLGLVWAVRKKTRSAACRCTDTEMLRAISHLPFQKRFSESICKLRTQERFHEPEHV